MVTEEIFVRDRDVRGTMKTARGMAPVTPPQVCVAVAPAGQVEAATWPTARVTAITMETALWTMPAVHHTVTVSRDSLTTPVRVDVFRVVS